MMHTLKGKIYTREVWLDGKELSPEASQKIYNHSPDGFCWGYCGSGPAQLALAICLEIAKTFSADYLSARDYALKHYHDFKWAVIANLPRENFEITFDSIEEPNMNIKEITL